MNNIQIRILGKLQMMKIYILYLETEIEREEYRFCSLI